MKIQDRLTAIALAITIRENKGKIEAEKLRRSLTELNEYQVFSIRQLSRMADISHSTLNRYLTKKERNGGKLNPQHLESLRSLIFQKDLGEVDYHLIGKMVKEGTSVDTIHKFTDIPKSTIHRRLHAS